MTEDDGPMLLCPNRKYVIYFWMQMAAFHLFKISVIPTFSDPWISDFLLCTELAQKLSFEQTSALCSIVTTRDVSLQLSQSQCGLLASVSWEDVLLKSWLVRLKHSYHL